jgi:hypothetical protein
VFVTSSKSYPMAGFGISDVDSLNSGNGVLVGCYGNCVIGLFQIFQRKSLVLTDLDTEHMTYLW